MRERTIGLSIADFNSIQEVYIHKKANEHGMAKITGILAEGSEGELFKKAEKGKASLYIKDEKGNKKNIFSGIIDSLEVGNAGGVKTARVVLSGSTKLLDCTLHTRTFQNEAMAYSKLLKTVNAGNKNVSYIPNCAVSNPIKKLIVQYRETDWEFLKRLASHFNQPILPDYSGEGIRYAFGLGTDSTKKKLDVYGYSSGNEKEEFLMKKENQVPGIIADDFAFYKVKSREYLELGERTTFLAQTFFVYESISIFNGEELMHTYTLRRAGGFKTVYGHNSGIIGASLDATILATKNDTVKVAVAVDGGQKESEAKWFPYSTVYSSPDGTGWYCMPEKGDKVRLYFPNEFEEDGYIISSINLGNTGVESAPASGGGGTSESSANAAAAGGAAGAAGGVASAASAPRSNPDMKTISNKDGKEVTLTPTTIIMTNNKGMMIVLDDEDGIMIASDKSVVITAEKNMVIKSDAEIDIQATDAIQLIRGDSKLTLKEELEIEGVRYKMQ